MEYQLDFDDSEKEPKVMKDEKKKTSYESQSTAKEIMQSIYKNIVKLIPIIWNKSIIIISVLYKFIFRVLSGIVFFIKKFSSVILTILGYILLVVSIFMFVITILFLNGIEVGGINYSNIIPMQLIISYFFLTLFILSISIYCIGKKVLLFNFIVSSILGTIAVSYGILGVVSSYDNYMYKGEIIQEYSIGTGVIQSINYKNIHVFDQFDISEELFGSYTFNIEASSNDEASLKVINTIYTKDEETLKNVEEILNNHDIEIVNSDLLIELKDKKVFNTKTDYIPMKKQLILSIPQGLIINLSQFNNSDVKIKGVTKCINTKDILFIENIEGNIICSE